MNLGRRATSAVLAAVAAATLFTACSKGSNTTAAEATADPAKVYSGATDTSNGGAMATPGAEAQSGGKMIAGDPAHGKAIYTQNCAQCHGASGTEGGVGPSLKGEKSRKDMAATVAWIKNPQPPMPKLYPSPLDEKDVADVAAYVDSL